MGNLARMCSGSEAGSYSRLIDFVYHSTLGLIVIKKKKNLARNQAIQSPSRGPTHRSVGYEDFVPPQNQPQIGAILSFETALKLIA